MHDPDVRWGHTVRRAATLFASLAIVAGVSTVRGSGSPQNAQAPAADLPAARQIIARHVAAIGGEAALKAVKSMRQRGKIEIAAQGLLGDFEILQARPNKIVQHSQLSGVGAIDEGYDGKVGWSIDPQSGPAVLIGRELSELAEDALFDAPLHPAERYASLRTVERTDFDKRPAYKVRAVFTTGLEEFEYLDAETGFEIGWEGSRATPHGILPMSARLRQYQRFGQLMFPTILMTRQLGVDQTLRLESVEFNTVPSSAFDLPKSIKALVR